MSTIESEHSDVEISTRDAAQGTSSGKGTSKGLKRKTVSVEEVSQPIVKKAHTTGLENWDIDNLLLELDFDVNKSIELFEYEGFNPNYIVKIIKEKQPNDKERQLDVITMCILNIMRGNNITNFTKTMKVEAVAKVNELRARYNIVKNVGTNRKTAITLSRVAVSYPYVCCHLMTLIPHGVISRTTMQSLSPYYPDVMRHPAFGSLIPKVNDIASSNVFLAHCLFQVRFSEIVNRQKGKSVKPLSHYLSDTVKFINVARHSGFVEEEEKIEWLLKWKLIEEKSGRHYPTSFVVSAVGHFLAEFPSATPDIQEFAPFTVSR